MTERARLFLDICTGLLARFAPSLLSLVCVPIYLHLLGASAYAAVGLAIALQTIVGLLDFGFSATITREAARISGSDKASPDLGTLLRTFELLFLAAAVLIIGIGLIFGYKILALVYGDNIGVIGLTPLDAWLLFASLALRFPYSCYSAYLVGLTQVSKANTALAVNDMLRALVAVALLSQWEASLTMFFAWQAISSLLTSLTGWWLAHRAVREIRTTILINWTFVRRTGFLTAGAGLMTFLLILVNMVDKMVLPRFLTASDFGKYVALTQLAAGAFTALLAIWSAFNPRIQAALVPTNSKPAEAVYEIALTTMTAVAGATIIGSGMLGGLVAYHWSGMDPAVGALVFPILMIGYLCAAVSHLPLSLQYAAGTLSPMLPAFLLVIIAVTLVSLGSIGHVSVIVGATVWSIFYVLLLAVGGSATHLVVGRIFTRTWIKFGIVPLSISAAIALGAAGNNSLQHPIIYIVSAAMAGASFATIVVASSPQCRNVIRQIVASRLQTGQQNKI